MIPRTPAIEYLVSKFIAGLHGRPLEKAELPPRPEKVGRWELRAALAIAVEEMRAEFAGIGSRVNCGPDMRQQLDVSMDHALTHIESALDQI
jgi:hypothetical protein